MISLAYRDLYRMNPLEARRLLLATYDALGHNISQTARALSCSRNTVRKFVRRQAQGQSLEDLRRTPKRCPWRTPKELEELLAQVRQTTNFGRVRLRDYLQRKHTILVPTSTIRNILRRLGLAHRHRLRGKFRALHYYDWSTMYPLQHFQVDLKEILDQKSLPWSVYQHTRTAVARGLLPAYQWTAIDPYTKIKFLAYSFEKTLANGLSFMGLLHLWLRSFGVQGRLSFQTDWGEEFGGKSLSKLERLQREVFEPWNTQLLRIRKGRWEDNAYVERTHRTDDEEFYVPQLLQIHNTDQLLERALKYQYTFNTQRWHYGKPWPGDTPFERLKKLNAALTKHVCLFPPLILDRVSSEPPFVGGHDLLAYYSRSSPSPHQTQLK